MCGIAGVLNLDLEEPAERATVVAMTGALVHRGPDGSGHHVAGPVALGHRRLAILDLAGGAQPMASPDGRLVLVYNGELYNYRELRRELEAGGRVFRTTGDTEVVLAAIEAWGRDAVGRFNGMWSLAVWDAGRRVLWASRDRLGEKPLYHAQVGGRLLLASELGALFAAGVERRPDPDVVDLYLALTFVPAPDTFFAGIRELPPGHHLIAEGGRVRIEPYWDLDLPPAALRLRDEGAATARFEELLTDAVRLRLASDVPFGAFLSGGLDSSSIVALMAGRLADPVRTFTIGTGQAATDERDLASLVANRFATDHVERIVTPGDAADLLPRLAAHFGQPFGDSSALPTYLVSRLAADRVKMVLTGDGGDEVLRGYRIHLGERIGRLLRPVSPLSGLLPGRPGRLLRAAAGPLEARIESKTDGLPAAVRARLVPPGARPVADLVAASLAPVADRDDFARLEYWLTRVVLPGDMLRKVDRMSMACSLETRLPFLDPRLVEFTATVHPDVLLGRLSRKRILRRSVGRRLPRPLLKAAKRGFGVPLAAWLAGGGLDFLVERARSLADTGLVRPEGLAEVLAAPDGRTAWILGMMALGLGD